MANISRAMQWWEEWQLRILVLGSLFVQWFLFFSASLRKSVIPSWFRFLIWLTYLGSDALAIYALATLFNRHNTPDSSFPQRSSSLEVLWAPILLMHLGGVETISAYNMEDNELWRRHIVTAMSQITVAMYVFCRSWPSGGDKQLLKAAILLFILGISLSLGRSMYLMYGSVFGLLSADRAMRVPIGRGGLRGVQLECFVQEARAFIDANYSPPTPGDVTTTVRREPRKLMLDLVALYPDRLHLLKYFWVLDDQEVYDKVRRGLSVSFDLIYTKQKNEVIQGRLDVGTNKMAESLRLPSFIPMVALDISHHMLVFFAHLGSVVKILLQLTATVLFLKSHKGAYNQVDVKVTYTLLCGSLVLNVCSIAYDLLADYDVSRWPEEVAQYSLIRYFIKSHSVWMILLKIMSRAFTLVLLVVDTDYIESLLQPLYGIESCGPSSSRGIVKLVLGHLKTGWKEHIHDAATYRMFNDQRGQLTLRRNKCDQDLGWSLMVPFDESVLLWHMATDFCFYYSNGASPDHQCGTEQSMPYAPGHCQCQEGAWRTKTPHHEKAVRCREISNYMIHLLYLNPELLMVGTRQYLFTIAFEELQAICKDEKSPMEDKELTQRIIAMVQSGQVYQEAGLIEDAWALAEKLLSLGDEKMWEVIQGVWVEKLCFSAARCRGQLHAKSLGTGGELLNYVWLLMSYMGMETLAEKLQRAALPSGGGNTAATPSTSKVPTGAAPSTSVLTGATSSTSEICVSVD